MKLIPSDQLNIRYVLENLRDTDRAECIAYAGVEDPAHLTARYCHAARCSPVFEVVATDDGLPTALYGISFLTPAIGIAHLLATPDFQRIARAVTSRGRRIILPDLKARGLRRLEARPLKANREACLWLEHFGASAECIMPCGVKGEDFVQYALDLTGAAHVHNTAQGQGPGRFRPDRHATATG